MDTDKIKRKKGEKNIPIQIRVTKEISLWLKEKNYSPTKIFYEALKELGCEFK